MSSACSNPRPQKRTRAKSQPKAVPTITTITVAGAATCSERTKGCQFTARSAP